MTDLEAEFHETWLGMVQPVEGLVVSVPVLTEAQCMERQPSHAQRKLSTLVAEGGGYATLDGLLDALGYPDAARQATDLEKYSLFVPEGRQVLRPTLALREPGSEGALVLAWSVKDGLDFDRPETETGDWSYPISAKLDRLLRHTHVRIGLLCNGAEVRLVYAPLGEASGSITFRIADMLTTGGRPIVDAFYMLLSAQRLYGAGEGRTLPSLLEASRKWQANVSERLAQQVFDATGLLLRGFEEAAQRDGRRLLDPESGEGGEHVHRGLLSVLLRVVFLLYAEDSGLMPMDNAAYRDGLSVTGLYEQLRSDATAYPESMRQRFGAWGRLLSVFRAVFLGVRHGSLSLPARRGTLFDPHRFPFLEGWAAGGSAPIVDAIARAAVAVPTVSDGVVLGILERLMLLEGQRLSYRSLDVEQIGSVYESMLGYTVQALGSQAACVRGTRTWLEVDEVLAVPAARRGKWLKELGLASGTTDKLGKALAKAKDASAVLDALRAAAAKDLDGSPMMRSAGALTIQPKRSLDASTTHYTPRALCRPLVARVLDPILAAFGASATSAQILSLKVCDPAMGSGAFLVEACRYLADHLAAAWLQEGVGVEVTSADPVVGARRAIAQRCLYGVDRNAEAVELAKLSLWLVTLARDLPFTFVDHALRHGDSLVGLDIDQIARFHWEPLATDAEVQSEIAASLAEALPIRARIEAMALTSSPASQEEKQRLLWDADDALSRVRVIADLVLAAYFGGGSKTERESLRKRHRAAVLAWLQGAELPDEVRIALGQFRAEVSPFHWMVELPEVFDVSRTDPLDRARRGGLARMDAFAGNMPFIGGRKIATVHGERYAEWLCDAFQSTGDADYVTYFFLRANQLLGTSGTIGFIATSSVSQGDTRRVGLQRLIAEDLTIYDAQTRVPWPGDAAVFVAPVLLAKGASRELATPTRLNGIEVPLINSRLRTYRERADPVALKQNAGVALIGCFLRGEGFVLSPDEAHGLLSASPGERAVVRPYLVGEDVARDPQQRASRFVVDFAAMDLAEAERYPRALAIVEERVRPDRERLKTTGGDAPHRRFWWRFANPRVALRGWLAEHNKCLVIPRVSKHLMVSRVATDQVFSEQVVVFTVSTVTAFAVLQSRVHEVWVRLLSSTMGDGLRYSATDCFDTFPFPGGGGPREVVPELEAAGERLLAARVRYMMAEEVGLTTLYNRLHEAAVTDARVVELRELHEALDRAVVAAYGWEGVVVPTFGAVAEESARVRFEDAVVEGLYALNDQPCVVGTAG